MILNQTDILMGNLLSKAHILILKKSEISFFSYLAEQNFFTLNSKYEAYPLRGGIDSNLKLEVLHEVLTQQPLFSEAWTHIINLEGMRKKKALSVISNILDYSFETPFFNMWRGKILIEFSDWEVGRELQNLTKLKTDSKVMYLDFSYPNRRFLNGYVINEFKKSDIVVTDKMSKHFIKRLGAEYELYQDYVKKLVEIQIRDKEKITTKMISKYTPYNKIYTYDDILKGILLKRTSQKQLQAISFLLKNYSPKYIIKVLISKITDLYYTKKAYVDGYLTPGLVKLENQAKNLPTYIPSYSGIIGSAYKIEKNLRILETIPLKEIQDVYVYSLRFLNKRKLSDLYQLVLAIEEREFYGKKNSGI